MAPGCIGAVVTSHWTPIVYYPDRVFDAPALQDSLTFSDSTNQPTDCGQHTPVQRLGIFDRSGTGLPSGTCATAL